ncbi:hypothetical protein ACWD6R_34750 [Streptomyces sp. NPDC005151]
MTATHVPAWWFGTSDRDGPGGSMRVGVEKAGKVGGEISDTAGASASVILAGVKLEYSVKAAAEAGITVGHACAHDIPAKGYGPMQYGSWGYKVNRVKYKTGSDRCGKVKTGSGTAKLPAKEAGRRYWSAHS